jgi:hypothetical protein
MAIHSLGWLDEDRSKPASWVSIVGPIFLQSEIQSCEPSAVFSTVAPRPSKVSCSNLQAADRGEGHFSGGPFE